MAVVGAAEHDDAVAAGGGAGQPDRRGVRLGSGTREGDAFQAGQAGQQLRRLAGLGGARAEAQAAGEVATPASDRYALAVVAYELLCGRRPFTGGTAMETVRAHRDTPAPRPDGRSLVTRSCAPNESASALNSSSWSTL